MNALKCPDCGYNNETTAECCLNCRRVFDICFDEEEKYPLSITSNDTQFNNEINAHNYHHFNSVLNDLLDNQDIDESKTYTSNIHGIDTNINNMQCI